jgi:hypothetical protein
LLATITDTKSETITAAVWNTHWDMVSVEHTHPIHLESLPLKPPKVLDQKFQSTENSSMLSI